MSNLHITNGDGAAGILKASTIEGDVLPWRDPMHHGPFPAGLDLKELSVIRSGYLAGTSHDESDARLGFQLRDDHLKAATRYDRVILWFEHDLLDQLQILQLLDWFADVELGDTELDLICIDHFEGIDRFRGLGELDSSQMASLIDRRRPVTQAQLDLARAGWAAFRSSDPTDLLDFMTGDLMPLPFIHAALMRHLEDYPWRHDGLTRTERQILTLVSEGVTAPGKLFVRNMERETALFIGDWPTFSVIAGLCNGPNPLLHCEPGGAFRAMPGIETPHDEFRAQRLGLTEAGAQILASERDAFDLLERDHWLGGVHFQSSRPMWVWDGERPVLRHPA